MKLALVGPSEARPAHDLIAARQGIFGVEAQIGEPCDHHPEELLGTFFGRIEPRGRFVLDETISQDLDGTIGVASV
jgi:hypothetical protein